MRIGIIGAGASGLMAAYSAAQQGAKVLLLEQHPRVGKKILATGNGRCNLLNGQVAAARYYGSGAAGALALLEQIPPETLLRHWEGLGLLCREEGGGRYYPASGHGGAVLDVLRAALPRAQVTLQTEALVQRILPQAKGGYLLEVHGTPVSEDWAYTPQSSPKTPTAQASLVAVDRVIVACGGQAGIHPKDATGYDLLKALGHPITSLDPGITPLRTRPGAVKGLKGVRVKGDATLLQGGQALKKESGELLFGDAGISGVMAMQFARLVGQYGRNSSKPLILSVDLLPERPEEAWAAWLRDRAQANPHAEASHLLLGLVHPRISLLLLSQQGYTNQTPAHAVDVHALARLLRAWELPILGTEDFSRAQVTAGGAHMDAFDPLTLESRLCPGLYAAGEILDVDGDCGGYNLMWAWVSGLVAGQAAASRGL